MMDVGAIENVFFLQDYAPVHKADKIIGILKNLCFEWINHLSCFQKENFKWFGNDNSRIFWWPNIYLGISLSIIYVWWTREIFSFLLNKKKKLIEFYLPVTFSEM